MGRITNTRKENSSTTPSTRGGRVSRIAATPTVPQSVIPPSAIEPPAVVTERRKKFNIDDFPMLKQQREYAALPLGQRLKKTGEFLLPFLQAVPRAFVSVAETLREVGGEKGASFTP